MTSHSPTHSGSFNLKTVIAVMLIALLLLLLASTAIQFSSATQLAVYVAPLPAYTRQSHAERHPEAYEVRECTERGDAIMLFRHRENPNRFAWLCQLPDGRWGIHVLEKVGETWEEITAFVRDQAQTAGDAVQYLLKAFSRFTGPLP